MSGTHYGDGYYTFKRRENVDVETYEDGRILGISLRIGGDLTLRPDGMFEGPIAEVMLTERNARTLRDELVAVMERWDAEHPPSAPAPIADREPSF